MIKGLAAFLVVTVATAGSAHAYLKAGPVGYGHWLQGAIAPLDGGGSFGSPAGAYSMRKLKSTYTGPAIRLRRASDNAEQDINFLSFTGFTGAPIDTVAANAHCTATTCSVVTWYDQSGNARHVTQAVVADQPEYVAACNGTLPCSRSALTFNRHLILSGITAISPLSLNAVAKQTARSTTGCREIYIGTGNELSQDATTDVIFLSNGSVSINAPSTGLAWHSHTGVTNGAASVVRSDATEVTGSLTVNVSAFAAIVNGNTGGGATCDVSEAIYWNGYALTAGERTALQANQKSFWGTP